MIVRNRHDPEVAESAKPASLALAQYAALPLMVATVIALAIAFIIRETYPQRS
jgi:hypothetical protein